MHVSVSIWLLVSITMSVTQFCFNEIRQNTRSVVDIITKTVGLQLFNVNGLGHSQTYKNYAMYSLSIYRNDPKFSDRYAWANCADPDQTAPRAV